MVTSNHIHLLVIDGEDSLTIPRSIQLVAGRTAQEYNKRKRRKGAFWEDRYHATAVQTGEHLQRCMAYIDLNMVRARVVTHPAEWECCGYTAIQNPPERYRVIDPNRLAELLRFKSSEELAAQQKTWVGSVSEGTGKRCESKWTESIAVGDQTFLEDVIKRLGIKARYRKVIEENGVCTLREPRVPYKPHFHPKNGPLSIQNSYLWNLGD